MNETESTVELASNESLEAMVSQALSLAQAQPDVTDAEVSISTGAGLSTTVRLGEVETLEYHQDVGFSITVFVGQQRGSACSSDLSESAILASVKQAANIARFTHADDCAGLAEPDKLSTDWPALALSHPWNINADDAIALTRAYEAEALKRDKRITNSQGADLSTYLGRRVYGNTVGFMGAYDVTRHAVSCSVIAADEDGAMQRDYGYTVARDWQKLADIDTVAEEAVRRTVRRLNARKPKTVTVPVLYESVVATSLLSHFLSAISGGNLYRKTSFLLDHLGEQIFPDWVQVVDDPFVVEGLGSTPFDNEGVQVQRRALIDDGVLQGYLLSTYAGRKLGMPTTGNAGGAHNVHLASTGESFEDCLKKLGTGVLVTELIGQGVNLVTGDYSRGASGFWVENGEIQYPVEEMTVAGNLRDIYANIICVGQDVENRSSIQTGSILVDGMKVAGI